MLSFLSPDTVLLKGIKKMKMEGVVEDLMSRQVSGFRPGSVEGGKDLRRIWPGLGRAGKGSETIRLENKQLARSLPRQDGHQPHHHHHDHHQHDHYHPQHPPKQQQHAIFLSSLDDNLDGQLTNKQLVQSVSRQDGNSGQVPCFSFPRLIIPPLPSS